MSSDSDKIIEIILILFLPVSYLRDGLIHFFGFYRLLWPLKLICRPFRKKVSASIWYSGFSLGKPGENFDLAQIFPFFWHICIYGSQKCIMDRSCSSVRLFACPPDPSIRLSNQVQEDGTLRSDGSKFNLILICPSTSNFFVPVLMGTIATFAFIFSCLPSPFFEGSSSKME